MTPLATQLFRHGDQKEQELLARCQFFECTKLVDMANEMAKADVELGGSEFSLSAQLPAPFTAIEALLPSGRFLVICEQHENTIGYAFWMPGEPKPLCRFISGFTLGTDENAEIQWFTYGREPRYTTLPQQQRQMVQGFNLSIEKMLLMISQTGLVNRVERPSDKRVQRIAKTLPGKPDVSKFFECRIRPGQHGDATGESGVEMPLHYVRKHQRPSSGKWIDGYWRGNADLGLHLKWYSPAAPKGGRA
jgi:hypothetical protein